ncbi:hypothetical protein A2853_02000 [Candidatus Kaiserbacteria bacterium RIFCSPHIGHO2_01_FULL_55_17]|uniref:Uncharacterized protein n=1 Tax=Candidatus Kaiserbacteria bacterium RIFCSPHIGHO2_01_FULL_55_17 TaxID=1798484 RepID=A0A1F6DAK4_9BACT|nr:MAG: hypothetical protein A2853_02000 [Candidatus Kaiserbacteria bacterium RIFCSPHIGHO2_01_FULL_55_17]
MTTILDPELDKQLIARLKELPKVVRDAIESADIAQKLRELANTHKLHVDQWQKLENEVMLALLGFQPVEELPQNIKKEIGVTDETAAALAADISRVVFEPIRQELERELEHPEAKTEEVSGVETARSQILQDATPADPGAPPPAPPLPPPLPVQPATPPAPPQTEKAVRGPASGAYKSGEPSATRKDIHDDPYREPPA